MKNTWEIMSIIGRYNKRVANVKKYSDEYDKLQELYAEAIRLQCQQNYGYVMTVDDFIKNIDDGYFTHYDGSGVFLLQDGTRSSAVRCDVDWLNQFRDKFSFVLWFNK